MDVDSKPAVIADSFYRANEAATIINHSQRVHTLFKSLLNSGTHATEVSVEGTLAGPLTFAHFTVTDGCDGGC